MVPLVPVAGEGLLLGLAPLGVPEPLDVLPPMLPLPDELPPMVLEPDGLASGAAPEAPLPIELLPALPPGGQFTALLPELLVAPVGGQSAALPPELVLPVLDAPELPMPLLPDEDGMPDDEGEVGELGEADGLVAEGLVGLVAEGLLP